MVKKRKTLKSKEKGCIVCGRKVAKRYGESDACGKHLNDKDIKA